MRKYTNICSDFETSGPSVEVSTTMGNDDDDDDDDDGGGGGGDVTLFNQLFLLYL